MITVESALEIARRHLRSAFPGRDMVIVQTVEHPIGWGVLYQTRKYMETHDMDDMLFGPGPLLILRVDGSVVPLQSYDSVEQVIRDFAREHGY
jgi:hypothetical protein